MLVALVLLATHVGGTLAIVPIGLIEDALTISGADATWPRRALHCARELGPSRCLKAFAICRADSAAAAAVRGEDLQFHLQDELDRFAWEPFANASESHLNARLLQQTERIFMGREVKMSYPGVRLDVRSRHNGSIRFDLKHDEYEPGMEEGRGRGSRWRRTFYRVVPFLLIPPLILAAILPFMLPAFMMLSMFAVLINNMAFTGSVFTLLRNNAFDDDYEKKVIYVNDGYKNEERFPHIPQAGPDSYGDEGFSSPHEGFADDSFSPSDFPVDNVHHFGGGVHHFDAGARAKKRHGHRRRPHQRQPGSSGGIPGGGGGGVGDGQDGMYVGSESELFASESDDRHELEAAPGADFGEFAEYGKSLNTDSQSAA